MTKQLKKYLLDVYQAILQIENFTSGIGSIDNFMTSPMVQSAVERQFTIIGEALNRASKLDSKLAISDTRQIIDLRNVLVHAYDIVSPEIIWQIVQQDLPILKAEVEALLPSVSS